jgi:nucleoside-diphosphate-sugar epimerase
MTRIAVTGGSGKAGRVVVRDLLSHGYEVRNVDRVPSPESNSPDTPAPFLPAELTDLGQAVEALDGCDAIVHLAAIPSPFHATPDVVFRTNVTSTYAVFAAAQRLNFERVVWASSETTLGLPFDDPPAYVPVDEQHERPESGYALSKLLGEEMARQFSRWTGIAFVGLRFSNVLLRDDYRRFPEYWDDPLARSWNLWSYVDESHVAESVRCALTADVHGADSFIVAAPDTVMQRPSREVMEEVFPGVAVPDDLPEHGSLFSSEKARRVLGYEPRWSWRELF